ncbi:hypothetical protein [Pseudomonas oryzihabitans]|uniref:hypothetical protein n=1 Tax=Pseudomonas oryzihabitans TaxID=47885 RepID=UPI00289412D3|nr:hypothetical protein [Pseudomonas oryzihabitans]MDT3722431.1 hypothetical protein [Pseudomonas oryzihabitans]
MQQSLPARNEHGNPYLPTYYKGRIYIDLSDHGRYAENFEKLLRWIYDKPLHKRPEIGPPPAFLQQTESIDVGTNIAFRRAIEAVRGGREHAYGAIDEYLGALALGIQKFRISFENQESFEERFLESIEAAYIYEVEFLNLIEAMAQYFERLEKPNSVHRFFERIAAYCYPDENTNSYRDVEFDNYKFIVHELFVSTIAILIKHERFLCASYLLETPYYVPKAGTIGEKSAQHYRVLFRDSGILEHRNRRLKLGRTSLQADLIKDRSTRGPIEFRNIMQADFVLYLYGAAKNFWWYPLTLSHLNFHAPEFEIFARASSSKYFEDILPIIGVSNKPELDSIVERFKSNEIQRPKWSWSSIDPVRLMGHEQLCTR